MSMKFFNVMLILALFSPISIRSMERQEELSPHNAHHRVSWLLLIQKIGELYHINHTKTIIIKSEENNADSPSNLNIHIIDNHLKNSLSISDLFAYVLEKSYQVCGPLGNEISQIKSNGKMPFKAYFEAINQSDPKVFSALCKHQADPYIIEDKATPAQTIEKLMHEQLDNKRDLDPDKLKDLMSMFADIHIAEKRKNSQIKAPYSPNARNPHLNKKKL